MQTINTCYKYKMLLAIVALFAALLVMLVLPAGAYAASGDVNSNEVCDSIGAGSDCKQTGGVSINNAVSWVINVISWGVGVIAVIMIIVAGAKFMTASGDSGKIASARTALVWAIIGLIVAALAQVMVKFVLKSVTVPPGQSVPAKQNSFVDNNRQYSLGSTYYVLPGKNGLSNTSHAWYN
ncbi:MAG: pilin [Candidatus Saccharimonadales bacterium]